TMRHPTVRQQDSWVVDSRRADRWMAHSWAPAQRSQAAHSRELRDHSVVPAMDHFARRAEFARRQVVKAADHSWLLRARRIAAAAAVAARFAGQAVERPLAARLVPWLLFRAPSVRPALCRDRT